MLKQFLFSIFISFAFVLNIQSQNDLKIVSISGDTVQFQIENLEPLELLSHDPDSIPHYGFFWIFGDGTFYIDPNYSYMDDSVSSIATHIYPKNNTYTAVSYMTELYSNHRPPRPIRPKVFTLAKTSNTLLMQHNTVVPEGRKIGITTNHHNRKNYETVYVIGSKPNNNSKRILFFYGSKSNNNSATPVSDSFNFQRTHLADYSTESNFLKQSTAYFDEINSTNFSTEYDSVLIYNLSPSDLYYIKPTYNNIDPEHRLFYILKTLAGMDENQNYRFLSILTSSNSYNISNYDNWNKIQPLLHNNLMLGNDYIEDFYLSESPVLGPHDPNHLRLTKIIKYGTNKYKLKFELEYCNDGLGPAKKVYIRLIDEQLEYDNWKIDDVRFKGTSFSGNSWDDAIVGNDEIYGLKLTNNVNLPEKSIIINPPDSCGYIEFTVSTNALGVNNILNRKSKMKACVSFSGFNDNELCAFWEFPPNKNPEIIDCNNDNTSGNDNIFYIMLGIIFLLLILLIFCCFIKR